MERARAKCLCVTQWLSLSGEVRSKTMMLTNGGMTRSLFLLHRAVLNALQTPQSEDEYQVVQRSRAALGTFCEMVIDSARCFGEELGPSPICCYYNIQAAVDYLQEQLRDEDGEALRSDIDYLLRTKRNYCDKWGF